MKRIFALLLVVVAVAVACSPPDTSATKAKQADKMDKAASPD